MSLSTIDIKYGRTSIPIEYDPARFDILTTAAEPPPLSDAEINARLDAPIDTPVIEDIVASGETVLIVVPDATRRTAAGQIVNLLVRRLIANGSAPHEINIIFATGIHRRVTEAEKEAILTPFIAQRIKTLDHDPRDLAQIIRLGETSQGIPIELNRALTMYDRVILVGGVNFHYFAGFTGGRKLVCPGLASTRTVSGTHKLAFDCDTLDRRGGVDTGVLDGNAVHEAFMEAVATVAPAFAINTITNEAGEATDIFCGDWVTSHRAACDAYAAGHTVHIAERRDVVIAGCGGYPHDINLIQAHKTLEAASHACNEGGTIILIAECPDGLGREDFLDWFSAANSRDLAARLCNNYQVNGQTAWSLLQKAERFDIKIVTTLGGAQTEKMRLTNISISSLITHHSSRITSSSGFIIPIGSKIRITDSY